MVNQINADSGIRRRSQIFRDLVLVQHWPNRIRLGEIGRRSRSRDVLGVVLDSERLELHFRNEGVRCLNHRCGTNKIN
jgi:hypothetical protein